MAYIAELEPGTYIAAKVDGDELEMRLIQVTKGRFGNNISVFGRGASRHELKGCTFYPLTDDRLRRVVEGK